MTSYSTRPVVRWHKPVAAVVIAILVYVAYTFITIYMVQYQVKTAATLACKEYVRAARSKAYDDDTAMWRKNFIAGARNAGVRLSDDQYAFTLTDEGAKVRCQAEVAFAQETDWPFLDGFVELEKIKTVHRTGVDWTYNKKY